ncbi:unnamed protein product [Pedinophyceae sp. YPF-701]|nr:unnamed protein product [Pedinophyceae sp. YPF-701]
MPSRLERSGQKKDSSKGVLGLFFGGGKRASSGQEHSHTSDSGHANGSGAKKPRSSSNVRFAEDPGGSKHAKAAKRASDKGAASSKPREPSRGRARSRMRDDTGWAAEEDYLDDLDDELGLVTKIAGRERGRAKSKATSRATSRAGSPVARATVGGGRFADDDGDDDAMLGRVAREGKLARLGSAAKGHGKSRGSDAADPGASGRGRARSSSRARSDSNRSIKSNRSAKSTKSRNTSAARHQAAMERERKSRAASRQKSRAESRQRTRPQSRRGSEMYANGPEPDSAAESLFQGQSQAARSSVHPSSFGPSGLTDVEAQEMEIEDQEAREMEEMLKEVQVADANDDGADEESLGSSISVASSEGGKNPRKKRRRRDDGLGGPAGILDRAADLVKASETLGRWRKVVGGKLLSLLRGSAGDTWDLGEMELKRLRTMTLKIRKEGERVVALLQELEAEADELERELDEMEAAFEDGILLAEEEEAIPELEAELEETEAEYKELDKYYQVLECMMTCVHGYMNLKEYPKTLDRVGERGEQQQAKSLLLRMGVDKVPVKLGEVLKGMRGKPIDQVWGEAYGIMKDLDGMERHMKALKEVDQLIYDDLMDELGAAVEELTEAEALRSEKARMMAGEWLDDEDMSMYSDEYADSWADDLDDYDDGWTDYSGEASYRDYDDEEMASEDSRVRLRLQFDDSAARRNGAPADANGHGGAKQMDRLEKVRARLDKRKQEAKEHVKAARQASQRRQDSVVQQTVLARRQSTVRGARDSMDAGSDDGSAAGSLHGGRSQSNGTGVLDDDDDVPDDAAVLREQRLKILRNTLNSRRQASMKHMMLSKERADSRANMLDQAIAKTPSMSVSRAASQAISSGAYSAGDTAPSSIAEDEEEAHSPPKDKRGSIEAHRVSLGTVASVSSSKRLLERKEHMRTKRRDSFRKDALRASQGTPSGRFSLSLTRGGTPEPVTPAAREEDEERLSPHELQDLDVRAQTELTRSRGGSTGMSTCATTFGSTAASDAAQAATSERSRPLEMSTDVIMRMAAAHHSREKGVAFALGPLEDSDAESRGAPAQERGPSDGADSKGAWSGARGSSAMGSVAAMYLERSPEHTPRVDPAEQRDMEAQALLMSALTRRGGELLVEHQSTGRDITAGEAIEVAAQVLQDLRDGGYEPNLTQEHTLAMQLAPTLELSAEVASEVSWRLFRAMKASRTDSLGTVTPRDRDVRDLVARTVAREWSAVPGAGIQGSYGLAGRDAGSVAAAIEVAERSVAALAAQGVPVERSPMLQWAVQQETMLLLDPKVADAAAADTIIDGMNARPVRPSTTSGILEVSRIDQQLKPIAATFVRERDAAWADDEEGGDVEQSALDAIDKALEVLAQDSGRPEPTLEQEYLVARELPRLMNLPEAMRQRLLASAFNRPRKTSAATSGDRASSEPPNEFTDAPLTRAHIENVVRRQWEDAGAGPLAMRVHRVTSRALEQLRDTSSRSVEPAVEWAVQQSLSKLSDGQVPSQSPAQLPEGSSMQAIARVLRSIFVESSRTGSPAQRAAERFQRPNRRLPPRRGNSFSGGHALESYDAFAHSAASSPRLSVLDGNSGDLTARAAASAVGPPIPVIDPAAPIAALELSTAKPPVSEIKLSLLALKALNDHLDSQSPDGAGTPDTPATPASFGSASVWTPRTGTSAGGGGGGTADRILQERHDTAIRAFKQVAKRLHETGGRRLGIEQLAVIAPAISSKLDLPRVLRNKLDQRLFRRQILDPEDGPGDGLVDTVVAEVDRRWDAAEEAEGHKKDKGQLAAIARAQKVARGVVRTLWRSRIPLTPGVQWVITQAIRRRLENHGWATPEDLGKILAGIVREDGTCSVAESHPGFAAVQRAYDDVTRILEEEWVAATLAHDLRGHKMKKTPGKPGIPPHLRKAITRAVQRLYELGYRANPTIHEALCKELEEKRVGQMLAKPAMDPASAVSSLVQEILEGYMPASAADLKLLTTTLSFADTELAKTKADTGEDPFTLFSKLVEGGAKGQPATYGRAIATRVLAKLEDCGALSDPGVDRAATRWAISKAMCRRSRLRGAAAVAMEGVVVEALVNRYGAAGMLDVRPAQTTAPTATGLARSFYQRSELSDPEGRGAGRMFPGGDEMFSGNAPVTLSNMGSDAGSEAATPRRSENPNEIGLGAMLSRSRRDSEPPSPSSSGAIDSVGVLSSGAISLSPSGGADTAASSAQPSPTAAYLKKKESDRDMAGPSLREMMELPPPVLQLSGDKGGMPAQGTPEVEKKASTLSIQAGPSLRLMLDEEAAGSLLSGQTSFRALLASRSVRRLVHKKGEGEGEGEGEDDSDVEIEVSGKVPVQKTGSRKKDGVITLGSGNSRFSFRVSMAHGSDAPGSVTVAGTERDPSAPSPPTSRKSRSLWPGATPPGVSGQGSPRGTRGDDSVDLGDALHMTSMVRDGGKAPPKSKRGGKEPEVPGSVPPMAFRPSPPKATPPDAHGSAPKNPAGPSPHARPVASDSLQNFLREKSMTQSPAGGVSDDRTPPPPPSDPSDTARSSLDEAMMLGRGGSSKKDADALRIECEQREDSQLQSPAPPTARDLAPSALGTPAGGGTGLAPPASPPPDLPLQTNSSAKDGALGRAPSGADAGSPQGEASPTKGKMRRWGSKDKAASPSKGSRKKKGGSPEEERRLNAARAATEAARRDLELPEPGGAAQGVADMIRRDAEEGAGRAPPARKESSSRLGEFFGKLGRKFSSKKRLKDRV